MFAEKTKGKIDEAIVLEYENAKERWGDKYASHHEGWAVLVEEIMECRKEYKGMKFNAKTLFKFIADGVVSRDIDNTVAYIMLNARQLAMEACQVAAVCQEMLGGSKQ